MNIGIIGAGNIGGTLTRRLTAIGHEVRVANSRGPESLADLAGETGATPTTLEAVAEGADIAIVAIPQKGIASLPKGLFDALPDGAVVIDAGNYVPHLRDGQIAELDQGAVESRWVESHLGHPVVKALNNITADHMLTLGKPAGTAGRIALPVAGDSEAAKATVRALLDELGFDAVDAGDLSESWRQQPGTPVYTTDLDVTGARKALADADSEHTTHWRDRLASR
jgi:predicted dinucleotide-binding enzyme